MKNLIQSSLLISFNMLWALRSDSLDYSCWFADVDEVYVFIYILEAKKQPEGSHSLLFFNYSITSKQILVKLINLN